MRSKLIRSANLALVLTLLLLPPMALAKVPFAEIDNNKIKLEVAQTKDQIEHGLMERTSMPEDQGMIFLFRPPSSVRFWMYNCLMSLDMMFIKDGKIAKISHDVPPYKSKDKNKAPLYPSDGEVIVTEVIEVNAGYCARHGIKEGDAVKFEIPGSAAAAVSSAADSGSAADAAASSKNGSGSVKKDEKESAASPAEAGKK